MPTASSQAQRQSAYLAAVREANFLRFSPHGRWRAGEIVPTTRERMWHCFALLRGETRHIDLANRILKTSRPENCDFNVFFSLWLLRCFEDRLSRPARGLLMRIVRDDVEHVHDHIFRYTENCAALNVFALLEAADRLEKPRYARRAQERLAVFVEGRHRNGASHEFISVGYLPVFLTGATLVARHARERRVRRLAEELEAALWRELAAAWHPELHFTAGPSGRSYTHDSMATYTAVHGLVWTVLGDPVCPSPMTLGLFAEPPRNPLKPGRIAFAQSGGAVWFATAEHRVSGPTARLFHRKRYPFTMEANVWLPPWRQNEPADPSLDVRALGGWRSGAKAFLPGTILHPGGTAFLATRLARDYGVGTSSRILWSQSDFFRAIWRRRPRVRALADARTLYTRYVVNDALERHLGRNEYGDLLPEQGRGGSLQSGPLAVTWYNAGEITTRRIARLRTAILLPCLAGDVDEIRIGHRACRRLDGVSRAEDWVFVRDGTVYLAFHPLALTNHGRSSAVEVQRVGRFRAITFANYRGRPRSFHPAALRQTRGGFVFLIGSAREWGTFARFRQACRRTRWTDTVYESQRRIDCRWNGHRLDFLWEMQTEELLWARRGGRFLGSTPIQLNGQSRDAAPSHQAGVPWSPGALAGDSITRGSSVLATLP